MEAVGHNPRSSSEAIARNPPALKQRRGRAQKGFNLSSSSSNAIGQPCKGFSLIEAAIVLGVVGLVVAGIWIAAAAIKSNMRVGKTAEYIMQAVEGSKRIFPLANYPESGDTDTYYVLKELSIIPKTFVRWPGVWPISPEEVVMAFSLFGGQEDPTIRVLVFTNIYTSGLKNSVLTLDECTRLIRKIVSLNKTNQTFKRVYAFGPPGGTISVRPKTC